MAQTKTCCKREDAFFFFKRKTHANQVVSEAVDSCNFAVFTNNKLGRNINSAFCAKPWIKLNVQRNVLLQADLSTEMLH